MSPDDKDLPEYDSLLLAMSDDEGTKTRAKLELQAEKQSASAAPREWWRVEGREFLWFDNEDESIRYAGYSAEYEPTFTYHFIESKVCDALKAENESLRDLGNRAVAAGEKWKAEAERLTALDYAKEDERRKDAASELKAKLAIAVEALEQISDPRKRDHKEPDPYTQLGCVMHIANEAIERLK